MTSPDNDPGRTDSSENTGSGSEPSSSGHEAPSIEQAGSGTEGPDPGLDDTPPQGYTPPPAYNQQPSYTPSTYAPPTPGYEQPPGYPVAPPYPPPPAGYAPPFPDAGAAPYAAPGYPPPGYGTAGYGAPSYPPPSYGSYPGGYGGSDYGYTYGGPAQQGSNNMAIGSLVTSLIAIPLNIACFAGTVASIVAMVLGVVALNQVKTSGQGGKELAIAGIVIGALGLVGAFVLFLLVLAS